MLRKKNEITNLFNSLALASTILLFHVILVLVIGILVLFLSGIVNYIFWIFLGMSALIAGSVYLFLRYMKKEGGKTFLNLMNLPELKGRNVEVNLLGGLASFKVKGDKNASRVIETDVRPVTHQLEDPQSIRLKELTELARLLENNLITLDEYQQAKKTLFGN